ncbi:MAG TPA: hypothetical protein VJP89_08745 [Pyrinomonadaceae bacterium]|nr:hypothetical protein [Pyrinomonadaceae bacterium]
MKNLKDLEIYEQYMERWKTNSLGKDDPILRMVTQKARKITSSWNCSDWADDLINETLIILGKGDYRGDGSIEGYVVHVMANLIKLHWRKERSSLRAEMPEDLAATNEQSLHAELELSDRTKRLIARTPQQFWWYLEFVADFEGYASERDAAKYAKVTRHQIQKLKEEIRRIWSAMERAKASGGGD